MIVVQDFDIMLKYAPVSAVVVPETQIKDSIENPAKIQVKNELQ